MPPARAHGKVRLRRTFPLVLALLLTACAADAGSPSTTVAAPPTTGAPDTTTTTMGATTTTTIPVDAARTFTDGVAASSANYKFLSTVMTGEETVTTIEGVVDHGSISATITAGTGQVSYVRTPDGEWIRETDGEWVEAEGAPPVTPPLASLTNPTGLAVDSDDAGSLVISGQLGAAAGDASGIPFTTTFVDGLVTEIRYEAETSGQIAVVTTVLTEVGDAGVVTAPEV